MPVPPKLEELAATLEEISRGYAATHGFDRTDSWFLLKLHEEIGELTQQFLTRSGQGRSRDMSSDAIEDDFRAELADVVAHALLVAHRFGIDIEYELEKKWLVWARQAGPARKRRTCLCFVLDDRPGQRAEVLLGRKMRGLGTGNIVGLGGHVEDGEDVDAAALREVHEEAGVEIEPESLVHAAQISFQFPAKPAWDQDVDVFITTSWRGTAKESDEITPAWYSTNDLPLDDMWDDARYWLPLVLAGVTLTADFTFADDNCTVDTARITPWKTSLR